MVRAASGAGRKTPGFPWFTASVESMSDGTRDQDDQGVRPADEAALSARLERLGHRLNQVGPSRASEQGPARSSADASAAASGWARGFRLSSELVAGVVVGAGLGWLIDRWLGSTPWGLMVFLLLGFAAGVLNVMRSAGVASGGVPDSTIEKRKDQ
jgi:ATP synthase protein I